MLDHGVLNLPLAKRGDIDAQIDRYKADQAKAVRASAKVKSAKLAADRTYAKNLVALLTEERAAELIQIIKVTPAQLRRKLCSLAHWNPALIIDLLKDRQ